MVNKLNKLEQMKKRECNYRTNSQLNSTGVRKRNSKLPTNFKLTKRAHSRPKYP